MAVKVESIRNAVFIGHGGVGKTTLVEAMLHSAGAVARMGSIDQKNTVCDFDDLEKERQHSIDASLVNFERNGINFNVIDTPGYPDFVGQALTCLAGADVAVLCVGAAAGIEVNTRRMMKAASDLGMPRMVVINKIDADNIDLAALVGALQEAFGNELIPMNLPADGGSKVINCFGGEGTPDFGDLADAKEALTDAVVESDEAMMERYLGGEEISDAELAKALKGAVLAGTVVPVLFTSATGEIGVPEMLDALANCCPSPAEAQPRKLVAGEGEEASETEIKADAGGPIVGQVFKIYADPKSNIKYSIIRLLSGTVKSDTTFHINEEKKSHRAGHLYKIMGSEMSEMSDAGAGEIFALAKIDELQLGDMAVNGASGKCTLPNVPVPMYSLAVQPKSRGDEQKISGVLARLCEEDPAFKTTHDRQTNELVISGIGDLHLRVVLDKMARRFKLEVETKLPKIPYRETVSAKADGHYRHKKQSGGAGQFGEVYLRVAPLERDAGLEFVNEIFGGSIPAPFLPAIEKGVRDLMERGAVAGFPMQDIKVAVYDGKHHPVDSKEIAFRIAGKLAMKDAIAKAKPVLLEPVVTIEVTVPSQFVGDITGDLSGRRGRIIGQDVLPGGMTTIKALVPLSEVAQYNSQLRSVTGGQGSYSMEFSHYDAVPPNIQQEIVKQYQPKDEED